MDIPAFLSKPHPPKSEWSKVICPLSRVRGQSQLLRATVPVGPFQCWHPPPRPSPPPPSLVKPAASQWSLWIKQNIFFFCAKGDVIKVNKAFRGRVTLPGYAASPLNGTMEISSLRTNDSGTYRCQIVMDNLYERDSVALVVSGKSCCGSPGWQKPTGNALKPSGRPTGRVVWLHLQHDWFFCCLCFRLFQSCCANVTQIVAASEHPLSQLINLLKH